MRFIEIFLLILVVITIIGIIIFSATIKRAINERFFQGRFSSVLEWKKAIVNRNIKWLNRTPIVPQTDSQILPACFFHNCRKNGKESIQVWQSAAIYLSLKEYLVHNQSEKCWVELNKFEQSIEERYKVSKINDADYGMLAYSQLDRNLSSVLINSMVKYMIENKSESGEIRYKANVTNVAFVDTIGFVCPFLVKYGILINEENYINLAIDQIKLYLKNGTENNSKLPFHAYLIDSHIKRGVCDWARGLAWLLIGMLDSYQELLHGSQYEEFFRLHLREYADILLQLQRPSGGFTWLLLSGYQTDSSAIAVFGWYLALCAEIFNNRDYLNAAIKCRGFLMSVTYNNGIIDYCQGDTIGIGVYSRSFEYMPFAQGFALRMQEAIESAERKKI